MQQLIFTLTFRPYTLAIFKRIIKKNSVTMVTYTNYEINRSEVLFFHVATNNNQNSQKLESQELH